jgi:hypothetical protein
MEQDILLKGDVGMFKRVVCLGVLMVAQVIKKFIISINPSKVVLLKPLIRIALPVIKGAREKIGEMIFDVLPALTPGLLSILGELKPYLENLNAYAKEFNDMVPDLILFLNEMIEPIIKSDEELSKALNEIEVPVIGNLKLKDMNITISAKIGKGKIYMGYIENPEGDATLVLTTENLLDLIGEFQYGMASVFLKVLTEEICFDKIEDLPKVRSLSSSLYSVVEDLMGIPIR